MDLESEINDDDDEYSE